ncbi:MAG: mannose-1-phosphate guanylyltransferase/mannose-6-phosphate isomerase [Candidatus Omnitrophota bacterium]
MKKGNLYALILAGGVGSRFWPLSRQLEPKQFLCVAGKKTLIQETLCRIRNKIGPKRIFLISNSAYYFDIRKQTAVFNIPKENIFLEPEGKNTCAAIGWAARHIKSFAPDGIMLVLPSDHLILKPQIFLKIIDLAAQAAEQGLLVTLGIKPTRADTGYGYIKAKRIENRKSKIDYLPVEKFLEKPSQKKANEYFRNPRYFWNSGIFIWKAAVILEEMRHYIPSLYARVLKLNKDNFDAVWRSLPAISIDYAILEKSRKVVTIPADMQWTDLGSWEALSQTAILKKDKAGNVIRADNIDLGSRDIFILGADRLITTVGLKDLVIVDTADALLVCRKDLSQKVKEVVDILKKNKRQERILHKTVKRPWGSYTVLKLGPRFKIKTVDIEPGQRLSLQLHRQRAEHWIVVEGTAKVYKGKSVKLVKANQSIYSPAHTRHRLENPCQTALKIVEVQTGGYLEEDDIVRFKDDYERTVA